MFALEVKEWVENPNYKEELEKWEQDQRYRNSFVERPQEFIEVKALQTKITPEQFEVIRKEVLKAF